MNYIFLIAGLVLLVNGADYLIEGSTSLAKRLRVPSLFIGLTVVAVGTSLPEFTVNMVSIFTNTTQIALGNIVGSNITNTLLVLGVVAIISLPKIAHSTVWREIPFSFLAAFVLLILVNFMPLKKNGMTYLTIIDGLVLLSFLVLFIYYLYKTAHKNRSELIDKKMEIELLTNKKTFLYIVIGMIGLYLGGSWTVDGAVAIAKYFGVSQFFISATVIALGTSFPELITSTKAALRNDSDLAVGNIVGSNILNIFWVLGTAAVIKPIVLPKGINIDIAFLIASSLLLFIFLFIGKKHSLEKWQGLIFISGYVFYIFFSIFRG
jgi:cation:H+ antiporter